MTMRVQDSLSLRAEIMVNSILVCMCAMSNLGLVPEPTDRMPVPAVFAGGKVVPSQEGIYAGLYNIGDTPAGYAEMADVLGGPPSIVLAFHDWNAAGIEASKPILQDLLAPMEGESTGSVLGFAEQIARNGSVLVLVWDPITYLVEHSGYTFLPGGPNSPITFDEVLSGMYDDYIRTVARQIKAFGGPIMISPFGEYNAIGFCAFGPEGNEFILTASGGDLTGQHGDPNVPDGPERVRDVHRHIVDVFDEENVTNVTWFMYSHTAYLNPADLDPAEIAVLDFVHPRHYYPGDAYVDWIGNSAYVSNDNPELDLEFAIGHVIDAYDAMGVDKPFFLTEFGVTESGTDSRADRITRVLTQEVPRFQSIKAVTFADAPLFEAFFQIPDLATNPGEAKSYRSSIRDSGFYTTRLRIR